MIWITACNDRVYNRRTGMQIDNRMVSLWHGGDAGNQDRIATDDRRCDVADPALSQRKPAGMIRTILNSTGPRRRMCEQDELGKMAPPDSNDLKIAMIQGQTGEFGIAFVSAGKEGLKYLYVDNENRFYFYPQVETKPVWKVDVGYTSRIKVSREDEARFRSNIEQFFRTRNYVDPGQEVSPGDAASVVTFTWEIAK